MPYTISSAFLQQLTSTSLLLTLLIQWKASDSLLIKKKLNKKPERIHIKTINSNSTFEQALRNLSVTDKSFEELAILNGMKLSDKVTAGMKIKILGL